MTENNELTKCLSSEELQAISEKEINEIDEHLSMLAEISIDLFLQFKSKNSETDLDKSAKRTVSPTQFYKTESIRTLSE